MTTIISYLSIVVAFASALFTLHLFTQKDGVRLPSLYLGLLFAVFTGQSIMLVSIINNIGPEWVAVLRPSLATTIGPLVYFYVDGLTRHKDQLRRTIPLHFLPALVIALQFISGIFLISIDLIIIASFALYAARVGMIALKGNKAKNRNDAHGKQHNMFALVCAVLLAISAIGETFIYADILSGALLKESTPLLLAKASDAIFAAGIVLLTLRTPTLVQWKVATQSAANRTVRQSPEHDLYIAAFETLTSSKDFFASEQKSLREVAKILDLPQRRLSEAINTVYGESFSRRMNRLRVGEAKRLMYCKPDTSLTEIMFDAGFRTKSSFNREFRLIEGCAPSAYRASLAKSSN